MQPYRLQYSEALLRKGIRAYWRRQVGVTFPLVALLLSGYLGYLLSTGNRSWLVGVLGTVIVFALVMMAAVYFVHLGRALKRLREMKSPEVVLELADEAFRITSDLGSSEIKWALVQRLWRLDDVWLLFFSGGEFMSMPVADLPAEARAYIEARLVAHGAEVA